MAPSESNPFMKLREEPPARPTVNQLMNAYSDALAEAGKTLGTLAGQVATVTLQVVRTLPETSDFEIYRKQLKTKLHQIADTL